MLIKNSPADELLRSAGLDKLEDKNNLKDLLENSGLGLESVLAKLSEVVNYASQEGNSLRAIDTVLKLHKVLEDDIKSVPSITINIQPPAEGGSKIPSILIPRTLREEITINV